MAVNAVEDSLRPLNAVYWYMVSFTAMDRMATHRARVPGGVRSSPLSQEANFKAPETMMPMAAATSARLMRREARVSNFPCP